MVLEQLTWTEGLEIIFIILALCACCFNLMTIYTVFFNKQLYTVPSIFIANWAIADIFTVLGAHINPKLVAHFEKNGSPPVLTALVKNSEWIAHTTATAFLTLIAIDWCLVSYFDKASKRFRMMYPVAVGCCWAASVLGLCVSLVTALDGVAHLPQMVFMGFYSVGLVAAVVLNVVKVVKRCMSSWSFYPTTMLTMATSVLLAELPACCFLVLFTWVLADEYWWMEYVVLVEEACCLSPSFIVFMGMYQYNLDFQNGFLDFFDTNRLHQDEKDDPDEEREYFDFYDFIDDQVYVRRIWIVTPDTVL